MIWTTTLAMTLLNDLSPSTMKSPQNRLFSTEPLLPPLLAPSPPPPLSLVNVGGTGRCPGVRIMWEEPFLVVPAPCQKEAGEDQAKGISGARSHGRHQDAAVEGYLIRDWARRSAVLVGQHEQWGVGRYMLRTCTADVRGWSSDVEYITVGNR